MPSFANTVADQLRRGTLQRYRDPALAQLDMPQVAQPAVQPITWQPTDIPVTQELDPRWQAPAQVPLPYLASSETGKALTNVGQPPARAVPYAQAAAYPSAMAPPGAGYPATRPTTLGTPMGATRFALAPVRPLIQQQTGAEAGRAALANYLMAQAQAQRQPAGGPFMGAPLGAGANRYPTIADNPAAVIDFSTGQPYGRTDIRYGGYNPSRSMFFMNPTRGWDRPEYLSTSPPSDLQGNVVGRVVAPTIAEDPGTAEARAQLNRNQMTWAVWNAAVHDRINELAKSFNPVDRDRAVLAAQGVQGLHGYINELGSNYQYDPSRPEVRDALDAHRRNIEQYLGWGGDWQPWPTWTYPTMPAQRQQQPQPAPQQQSAQRSDLGAPLGAGGQGKPPMHTLKMHFTDPQGRSTKITHERPDLTGFNPPSLGAPLGSDNQFDTSPIYQRRELGSEDISQLSSSGRGRASLGAFDPGLLKTGGFQGGSWGAGLEPMQKAAEAMSGGGGSGTTPGQPSGGGGGGSNLSPIDAMALSGVPGAAGATGATGGGGGGMGAGAIGALQKSGKQFGAIASAMADVVRQSEAPASINPALWAGPVPAAYTFAPPNLAPNIGGQWNYA